eukprot:484425-Rhodomonas_salina.5
MKRRHLSLSSLRHSAAVITGDFVTALIHSTSSRSWTWRSCSSAAPSGAAPSLSFFGAVSSHLSSRSTLHEAASPRLPPRALWC